MSKMPTNLRSSLPVKPGGVLFDRFFEGGIATRRWFLNFAFLRKPVGAVLDLRFVFSIELFSGR
jgi:hypothetical protein